MYSDVYAKMDLEQKPVKREENKGVNIHRQGAKGTPCDQQWQKVSDQAEVMDSPPAELSN